MSRTAGDSESDPDYLPNELDHEHEEDESLYELDHELEWDDDEELDEEDLMDMDLIHTGEAIRILFEGQFPENDPLRRPHPRKLADNANAPISTDDGGLPSTERRRSVYSLLKSREMGVGSPSGSTLAIAKNFIPNKSDTIMDRYNAKAYSGQFSEDGNFFFACTQDFQVHLYDTSDLSDVKQRRIIKGKSGRWTITDCSLSPDNRKIIYSSITPVVYITSAQAEFDSDDSQIPLYFDGENGDHFGIWSIRFSGDGREIVAGASNQCLYVYDIETRQVLHEICGHEDDVNAVCFADPSSHVLFSASDDSFVKVWDRRSLRRNADPQGVFVGHTEGITYVASKNDGRYALSNGKDQQMKMWDLRKMMEPGQWEREPSCRVGYYSENFDYRFQSYPGSHQFRHPKDCSVQTFTGHSVLKTLIRCYFSPERSTGQRYVYTGSEDGIARVYSLDGKIVQELDTSNALKGINMAEASIQDLLRPRRNMTHNVTRDVSWHPDLPCIISTSWYGFGGATVMHEYGEE